ncbi:MAG: hypothetical protein ACP5M4_01005 [Acidobacteriaceae bacterium]
MTELSAPEPSAASTPARGQLSDRADILMRSFILALLYSVMAIIAVRSVPGVNIDMWWHMSSARWMLEHHALPHTAIYANLHPVPAWHAYSWLYDLMMLGVYRAFGLVGVLGYITVMVLAILTALHRMTGRLQHDFLPAIVLALLGAIVMMPVYTPRSWLFSVFFFIVQLDLLHRARSSGQWKLLLWLLPLYALWSNIHIQFFDGLVVLAATALEPVLMRFWFWPERPPISAGKLFAILGGCIAATWVNPYGWSLYVSAFKLVSEHYVFSHIQELGSIPFRMWQNYAFLGLVIGAAVVLARREKPDLWRWMLFSGGLIVSFRSYRDIWFLTAIAVMILAEGVSSKAPLVRPIPRYFRPVIAVVVLCVALVESHMIGVSNSFLSKVEYEAMPVRAADAILEHQYPGPIFNTYEWGGYLIWRTQRPVSIDGRAAVYGSKIIRRNFQTWGGGQDWEKNPELKAANLVIGPVSSPLTQILRMDSNFQLVYQDKTAAVFVRKIPVNSSIHP